MTSAIKEQLRGSRLFAGFDEELLEEIATAVSLKRVTKGEMIFYEKDPAFAFFIVYEGKVKVFKLSPEGKEQILLIANPGESFAEAALFGSGHFPASSQALADSSLIVVHQDKFVQLVDKKPVIALKLVVRMAELLHKLNRLVEELSLTDITTRLAHYLTDEVEKSSYEKPLTVTLAEKKTVLASQLGTIPETLSRSFAKLTKDNVIKVDGSVIEILDLDRLYEIAGE